MTEIQAAYTARETILYKIQKHIWFDSDSSVAFGLAQHEHMKSFFRLG